MGILGGNMGYRSEVCIVMKKNVVDNLLVYMSEVDSETREQMQEILNDLADQHIVKNDAELYYWDCIKWYPEFKGVDAIQKLLENSNKEDYLFLRLGEDVADTESSGDYWENPFDAHTERRIAFEDFEEEL